MSDVSVIPIDFGPQGVPPWTTPSLWTANEDYTAIAPASAVTYDASLYICTISHHSSSDFAADLGAGKWILSVSASLSSEGEAAVATAVAAAATATTQAGNAAGSAGAAATSAAGAAASKSASDANAVQTASDRTATAGSASAAAASAATAATQAAAASTSAAASAGSASAAAGSASAAAASAVQTGSDVSATGASASAAASSATAAAGSATSAAASASSASALLQNIFTTQNAYATIAIGRAAVADGANFLVQPFGTDGLQRFTVYKRLSSSTQQFLADTVTGTEYDDTKTDAASLTAANAKAITVGRNDLKLATDFATNGILFGFLPGGVSRIGTDSRASPTRFPQWSFSRASSALALDASGVYQTFATNVTRQTSRGILLEAAATNIVPAPQTFTGSGWSGASYTTTTGQASPDAVGNTASLLTQTGASDSSGKSLTVAVSAGSYALSFVLKRASLRYLLLAGSVPGVAGTYGFSIDWDASGGPAILDPAGSLSVPSVTITALSGGYYRFAFSRTPASSGNLTCTLRTTSDGTYANRGSGGTTGTPVVYIWHAQVETGTIATSPILTASTRSADVLSLTIGSGGSTDSLQVDYEGGSSAFARSTLASSTVFNFITDGGGAWLGKYMTAFGLYPARDPSYRAISEQIADAQTSIITGWLSPLRARIDQLSAMSALTPWDLDTAEGVDAFPRTENGSTLFCYAGPLGYYWHGQRFGTEAAMLAAIAAAGSTVTGTGAIGTGATLQIGGWTDTVNQISPPVDFTIDKQGFTNTSGTATTATSGAEIQMTSSGSAAAFSRTFTGLKPGAYKGGFTARRITDGNIVVAFGTINANLGGAPQSAAVGTTAAVYSAVNTVLGTAYLGGYHGGGTQGTSGYTSPFIYETRWSIAAPTDSWTMQLQVTSPGSLPGSTQVIASGDIGVTNSAWRLEWHTDGSLHFLVIRDITTLADVTIGTLAAGVTKTVIFGANQSWVRGAMDGAGAEARIVGGVYVSSIRFGRSVSGETFGGTFQAYGCWKGLEKLAWMKRNSVSSPISTRKLWIDGDSYSIFGSTGIGQFVVDSGYDLVDTGVGGDYFANEIGRLTDSTNLSLYGQRDVICWEASPNSRTVGATFTASIAGNVMTVSSIASGVLAVGQIISKSTFDVLPGTYIVSQLTGTTGSTGTYQVSVPQTLSSTASINAYQEIIQWGSVVTALAGLTPANNRHIYIRSGCIPGGPQVTLIGSISGSTLTVSSGTPVAGYNIVGPNIPPGVTIVSGAGTTWTLSTSINYPIPAGTTFMAGRRSQDSIDMDTAATRFAQLYGLPHVFDHRPIVNTFAIQDPNDPAYWQDQIDIATGYCARSTLLPDGIHEKADVLEAIVFGVPLLGLPGLQANIETVRRL